MIRSPTSTFSHSYVVMELVKNYAYAKSKVNLTYFRDSNAKEIDVFVEENNVIHPLEIKKSAAPDRREIKKYSVIDKASLTRGNYLIGQCGKCCDNLLCCAACSLSFGFRYKKSTSAEMLS